MKPTQSEHAMQAACVRWFRFRYPSLSPMLIAVPNAGKRSMTTAAHFKAEGMTKGVADLLLLVARGAYGSLCIEMKTAEGRVSPEQRQWLDSASASGNMAVVCRSLDDFMAVVEGYLNGCKKL